MTSPRDSNQTANVKSRERPKVAVAKTRPETVIDDYAHHPVEISAVLKAAREMTEDLAISDQTFAVLESGLDSECLTDLVLTIGFYNGVVRVLASLQIDVEDEYLGYLEEFPLPEG